MEEAENRSAPWHCRGVSTPVSYTHLVCWIFGIPCSKSHSLIAGITGGAIALNGWAGVVPVEWAKVIYGMVNTHPKMKPATRENTMP